MADILNIPGKIHSTAANGRAVETNEVYDNDKETFQSSINANFESRIIALHAQDYLYYNATSDDASIATILPLEGATGKIYRIANWNANATGVDPYYNTAYYSEYAWDANASTPAYTLLSVSASGITDIPAENDSRLITSRGVKSAIDNVAFSTNEKLNQVGIDSEPTAGSDNLVKSGGVSEYTMRGNIDFSLGSGAGSRRNVQLRFWANTANTYILQFDSTNWISDEEYVGVQLGCFVKYQGEESEITLYYANKGSVAKKILLPVGNTQEVEYLRLSLVGDVDKTVNFSFSPLEYLVTKDNGFDFSFTDDNGNYPLIVDGGYIRTKNFDSRALGTFIPVVGKYRNKVISILGDSISTFGVPSASNEDGTYCTSYYPVETCRYSEDGVNSIQFDVENTWWMKLIKAIGGRLGTNESIAGTTICNAIDVAGNRPLSSQERISHLRNGGNPDLIIIFGGTNDIGRDDLHIQIGTFDTTIPADLSNLPNTTFADAVKAMCLRIMSSYPDSEVVALLPTYTTGYYRPEELDAFVEMMKTIYDFFGIKYIDTRIAGISIYNRASYFVDGIHPNEKGMQKIFEYVYKSLILN